MKKLTDGEVFAFVRDKVSSITPDPDLGWAVKTKAGINYYGLTREEAIDAAIAAEKAGTKRRKP